ncbi:MAG: hypothetical protein F6J86_14670 [Symploca sp. SIO1B1]|nr:hypothetical protein [Symploca sp. SIO1B1]
MTKTLEQALLIYESVSDNSDLETRAKGIYDALDGLMGEENIAQIANAENKYLRERYSANSIGTKMSQAGYNKLIRQITLVDGENAYQETKRDGSKVLKHYFFQYCGLKAQEWDERNASNRVYNRLQKNIEVDPTHQIETGYKLLQNPNPWEMGAGLIAVSGRRPHEIVARAKFTPVEGEEYQVLFEGQGKKRGEKPVFPISLLVPVEEFLKTFRKFRAHPDVKAIINEAKTEASGDIPKQNRIIDRRSNKCLNRVVKAKFEEILPPRNENENREDDEADINCTALKSAYLAIATKRDCEGSPARQMLFASKLAGHFIDVDPNDQNRLKKIDRELQHLVTTLGYMGYHIKGEVPFFQPPKTTVPSNKLARTRLLPEDRKQLDEWEELWGMSNQAETMHKVFELARIALSQPTTEQKQQETEPMNDATIKQLEQKFEAYQQQTDEKFNQLLQLLQNPQTTEVATTPEVSNTSEVPTTSEVQAPKSERKQTPKQPSRDWASVSKAELFGEGEYKTPVKGTGATSERVRRAIEAIMTWNDQFPAESNQERKWSINIRAVRDLAGVNNQAVKGFIETHPLLVSDHNIKHGIDNQYHNRCHKAEGKTSTDLIRDDVYPLIQ